jgi:hypothetical protein
VLTGQVDRFGGGERSRRGAGRWTVGVFPFRRFEIWAAVAAVVVVPYAIMPGRVATWLHLRQQFVGADQPPALVLAFSKLCRALAGLPVPRGGDGQIRLAVDVTPHRGRACSHLRSSEPRR